jgi:crotonobetainyl-CoA:carnitine CoA-transferase CaiB-like acyl-CoA transferase
MMLADLGADVIKVERPGWGDDTRGWGPPYAGNHATYFLSTNRGKRSVALDLEDPADLALARRLAERADVLVENFRPGVMERFGLAYEDLRDDNPGLIYCSISGFGRGIGARRPAYDLILQAVGGVMSITGSPDGAPTKVGFAIVDVLAGLYASIGVLAALAERTKSGCGQFVDINLLSSALAALSNQTANALHTDHAPGRMGNEHPSVVPYTAFELVDGWIVIGAGTDRQFIAMCSAIGSPELAESERFASNQARVENRDELTAELQSALGCFRRDELLERLARVDVPCGPVNSIPEALALAAELGLDPVAQIAGPGCPPERTVANPVSLSETPVSYRQSPPALDEHGGAVRSWLMADLAPDLASIPPNEG